MLLIGCNSVRDESVRCEPEQSFERKTKIETDMIYHSYDDYMKAVRECLWKEDYNGALEYHPFEGTYFCVV